MGCRCVGLVASLNGSRHGDFGTFKSVGPYRLWVYTHSFEQVGEGTLARDSVAYSVVGGDVTNNLFVARNLRRIFRHRAEVLNESL